MTKTIATLALAATLGLAATSAGAQDKVKIGLIAALLGFGGIAGTSFAIAKVIFFIALILLLLSIIVGAVRRPL